MTQIQSVRERQTIENAIEALEKFTSLKIFWTQDDAHINGIDGFMTFNNQTFPIEHKQEFSLSKLPSILQKKSRYSNLILVSENFSENIKIVLRNNKINYLDTGGNSYIQLLNSLIFINGQKTLVKPEYYKDKAFTKRGLTIVFHFLNDDSLLNTTYRHISAVTGASLDTITKVIQSLRQQGFIIQIDDKSMRLIDKKRLFEKWADAYENRLKPHLFFGSFRFQNIEAEKGWQNITLTSSSAWGGEPAASILTDYFLRPAIYTLYSIETKNDLIKNYRFLPDPDGNIKVYIPFITIKAQESITPLWVYADMLNSGSIRNIEVAQKIYDKYVQNIF